MAWQEPKIDWHGYDQSDPTADVVGASDFNRIEGNENYLKDEVDNIKDGTTTVPSATNAVNATNSTNATSATVATKMDGVRVRVYIGTTQEINAPSGTSHKVDFDTETFDPKSKFDTTNNRCTPGIGTFLINAIVNSSSISSLQLHKNGSIISYGTLTSTKGFINDLVNLTNANDYLEIFVTISFNPTYVMGGSATSYWTVTQIA